MGIRPLAIPLAALSAALTLAAPAAGSSVLVYDGGHVNRVDDPALPPPAETNAIPGGARICSTAGARPVAGAAVVSVRRALRRAYDSGQIDQDAYSRYSDAYSSAKSAW